MNVKIDTKEKFHVITLPGPQIPATMTEELSNSLLSYLQNDVKNVVLKLNEIAGMDILVAETLVKVQQRFYEKNASFIICEINPDLDKFLEDHHLLELMNTTPTESEAWDIVQMEEIERELLDSDDFELEG
ncbi:MAG: STAS domain-containing protein [Terrimonas sp.]|nr:STAS domain-containing protein [Terrimonas sp.]